MATVPELIDRGVKAYLQGRVADARRAFEEALRRDPANQKARSYLVLIGSGAPGGPAAAQPKGATRGAPANLRPAAPAIGSPEERQEDFAPSPWDDGPASAGTFVLDAGGGLDLAAVAEQSDLRPLVPDAPRTSSPESSAKGDVQVWMQAARELHALGDFSGSLELIEKILQVDPAQAEARAYLTQNEATLIAMYESKLGSLTSVPRLAIKPEEVMWLNLDHRAGFLLAQIDGSVDYDNLFALSGLPRLDTARILARLIADGVITSR